MRSIILKRLIKISVFAFLCLCFLGFAKVQAKAGELHMHTINIGHGDAILFESQGHYMLVDSGLKDERETLLAYLEKNITGTTIDYAVASHADKDHIGGFYYVFQKYDVKNLIYSEPMKKHFDEEGERTSFGRFEDAIEDEAKEGLVYGNAYEGQTFSFGDATVKVIYDGRQGTTFNESSIVMRVTCGKKSILMTGDLPTTMETKLIDKGYKFGADILKVAHHGAAASTSTEFLDKVDPEYAVIPNGIVDGVYLPKDSVLQRLALKFIKTHLVTEGDIVMNIKDDVISTDHKENTKFQCLSRGQIVVNGSKFYASNTIGKKVTPSIHVYANGELLSSSNYTVSYTGTTHTGYGTIKVTGNKKKYVGTLSTTFSILPRQSKIWKSSRTKNKKKITIWWSTQNYASGYTIWYSSDKNMVKDSKKITIKGGKNSKKTFKGLKKKKHYYFKIQAFTNGIGKGKWTAKKKIK
ncbi:MAG: MBL fold metallo-hydrolase [Eubacterium sp.]|nr:MBL fold metallo-hydrolase [Eubacterium sp.]